MATTLFLREDACDCHLGHNNARLTGAGIGWLSRALATTRGASTTTRTSNTVAGPTAGIEIELNSTSLHEWISPPLAADVTIAGTITLNIWASESNMSANVAINAVIEVIRANAAPNTLVEIARSTRTTEVAVTTKAVNNFTVTPTSTVVNKGDRLRVRIFGDDAGTMASGFNFNIGFSGPTAAADGDTFVTFTEDFSFLTAPAGTQIFLTDTASDVATASVDREAWTSRGGGVVSDTVNTVAGWTAPIQMTDTAGGTVVDWFTKQLVAFTLTGMAQANLRVMESSLAANVSFRCEIARVESDGTSPTVWATWCIAPSAINDGGEPPTSEVARTAWVSGDDLAISDGQRLRIRIYIDDMSQAAMGTGNTATLFYAGTSGGASGDSWVTFDQTLTEFAAVPPPPRYPAINHANPGVLMKELRQAWRRQRNGILVPDLWLPESARAERVREKV